MKPIRNLVFIFTCALAVLAAAPVTSAGDAAPETIVITNADLPRTPIVSVVGTLKIDGVPATDREMPIEVEAPEPFVPTVREKSREDDGPTWYRLAVAPCFHRGPYNRCHYRCGPFGRKCRPVLPGPRAQTAPSSPRAQAAPSIPRAQTAPSSPRVGAGLHGRPVSRAARPATR